MKNVFISQPMNGKTDSEIRSERERAIESIKKLHGDDVYIINSFFEGATRNAKPLWLLGKSFELLSTADVAYFVRGWEEARGCVLEHAAATAYGLSVEFEF